MSSPPEAVAAGRPVDRVPGRIDFLDGVRALAAVYVVVHHMWLTVYPGYPDYRGPALLGPLAYGQLAVAVFIVVSGYSLSIAPSRHGWVLTSGVATYLRRRAWRILPTYWAALLFSCLVYGLVTPRLTGGQITTKGVAVHALLLQDVIGSAKPNGAFWSIAVEWQIYFLFPLLLLVRRRVGAVVTAAAVVTAVVVVDVLAGDVSALAPLLNLTPQFLALFALGMAVSGREGDDPRPWWWATAAGGVTLVVLLATHDLFWLEREYFWVDLIGGGVAACLLAALRRSPAEGRGSLPRRFFAGRVAAGVGRFSYSVYCVHLPLLWLVWHFVLAPLDLAPVPALAALLLVGLPAVLAGAWAFAQFFELPFVRYRSFAQLRDAIHSIRRPDISNDLSLMAEEHLLADGKSHNY